MAINSKNYVDISTTFPMAGSRSRAFGGLVFTYDGLLGVAVDSDTGLPVPKDEDGVPYPKEHGSYVIKVNNVSYPFVWDAKSGYVATVGNRQYSPANSSVIHAWIVFESGADLSLSLEDTLTLFGATSKEYEFANGYYSYISPSGRFPSKLRFAKVSQGEAPIDAFKNVDKSTNAFGSFTFLTPDSGRVKIGDMDCTYVMPNKRNTGMVFQSYALFPHMSVKDNIGFGLKMHKISQKEMDSRIFNEGKMGFSLN